MMTMTLELPEKLQRRLEEMAQQQQKTPEAVALETLRLSLDSSTQGGSTTAVSDEEFEAVAHRVIARDRELLERLAK